MAINLQKGQKVDIGLNKVGVGLGWDPNNSGSGLYCSLKLSRVCSDKLVVSEIS